MQIQGYRFELGAFRQFALSIFQIGVAVMLIVSHEEFLLVGVLSTSRLRACFSADPMHS
jgi:hypothetical protein